MKTALQLLGGDKLSGFDIADLERVAERAREEMREAAAREVDERAEDVTHAVEIISALPVKPC